VADTTIIDRLLTRVRRIPPAFGARATGARLARMRRSPQYRDGAFRNPAADPVRIATSTFRAEYRARGAGRPAQPVPLHRPEFPGPAGGLHLVWFGHAATLVEIEGRRVLFDPVWSERCSPSQLVGPRRLHRPPVPLAELGAVDAVVISHDHYDHLDMATIQELSRSQTAPFVVPLGVGAHLDRWGVPASRVVELDWDGSTEVDGVTLTATAAHHFSGRTLARNDTLWTSWVVAAGGRRVFYTGDSGYFPGYEGIGAEHGPFDAALVQIGAYSPAWPDVHMTPEDAVTAHLEVRGGLLVPVHWATFNLAFHAWAEPVDRLWREAKARGVPLAVPRPGERIDVDDPPAVDGWWQTVG
jgi:L-ascorbate metabolism protein UlaG (beta-lactamase superfamily)